MAHESQWDPRGLEIPSFGARRLLLIASGSSAAVFLPFWMNWLSFSYRDLECQIVLTRSAQRFVTRQALTGLGPREVFEDSWSEEAQTMALHTRLAQWPDAIAVYPATMHFISRLALGVADTPAMLALQCTNAPVGIAAALPPGGWDSAAMARHRKELSMRRNVALMAPVAGRSMTTGRHDGNQPDTLPRLLGLIEQRRVLLQDTESPTASTA